MWDTIDGGATIGKWGSEDGVILRDEEFASNARITLERGARHAPYAITCGIYGWMFHTRYCSSEEQAKSAFETMKERLTEIIGVIPEKDDPGADERCAQVVEAIEKFVQQFP